MNKYCTWVKDYTQRNPLKAVSISFLKGLVIATLIAGCCSSASAQSVFTKALDVQTRPSIEKSVVQQSCDECNAADINGDGTVTIQDILAWNAMFGQSCCCPADVDGNGHVGVSDKLIILAYFGETCD